MFAESIKWVQIKTKANATALIFTEVNLVLKCHTFELLYLNTSIFFKFHNMLNITEFSLVQVNFITDVNIFYCHTMELNFFFGPYLFILVLSKLTR